MTAIITAAAPPVVPGDPVRRLGLVVLSTDLTIEADTISLMQPGVRVHVSRVSFTNPTTPENLAAMVPHLAASADLILPGVPLAAIGFGCTSGSVVIGDDTVRGAIAAVRPGVPVVTPVDAAVQGFAALGVTRIALLTPYLPQTAAPVAEYFAAAGLDVVRCYGLGMADDRDIARVAEDDILAAVRATDDPAAQAFFVSCTALPVLRLIPRIEAALGKPVLGSNQALGWGMLRAAGQFGGGPGQLFASSASEGTPA